MPYRCDLCVFGIYNYEDSCWKDGCSAKDDNECESLFKDKREDSN